MNKLGPDGKIKTSIIKDSVARMLGMVRWYCPRKKGKGWKLQKFHDLLHLAVDMERFGPPSNFDAGPMESGLRYWAKLPALTSQTRGYNTFAKQVAWRTFEFQCIAKAMRLNGMSGVMDPPVPSEEEGEEEPEDSGREAVPKGTKYRIYGTPPQGGRRDTGEEEGVTVYKNSGPVTKKKYQGAFTISSAVETYLRFQQKEEHDDLPFTWKGSEVFWELRTEVLLKPRNSSERITLRCHPNYRNEGPWFDWAIVHFENNHAVEATKHRPFYQHDCLPSKIIAVMEHPSTGEIWILVHGCNFRPKAKQREIDTVLLEHWELAYHDISASLPESRKGRNYDGTTVPEGQEQYMAPLFTWVQPKNIVARCLVVEEEPGIFETCPMTKSKSPRMKNRVVLVRRRDKWPFQFTS